MRGIDVVGKRASVIALILLVVVTLMPTGWGEDFNDVPENAWYSSYVEYLSSQAVVSGYPDQTFRPKQPVTRAEFAVMLAKSQGLNTSPTPVSKFNDVPEGHWASGAIRSVTQKDWMSGYPGGRFEPNQPITLAELYTVSAKMLPAPELTNLASRPLLQTFQDDEQVPDWAVRSVATALQNGTYVSEVTPQQIEPGDAASRADVATTLAKVMNPELRTPVQTGKAGGTPVNAVGQLIKDPQSGDWAIVTDTGKTYYLALSGEFDPTVFNHGTSVAFAGMVDPESSTDARTVIHIQRLSPVSNPESQTPKDQQTVLGALQPAVEAGGWTVMDRNTGKKYLLLGIESAKQQAWFKKGATVQVTGHVDPDVMTFYMEGTPFSVKTIEPVHQ